MAQREVPGEFASRQHLLTGRCSQPCVGCQLWWCLGAVSLRLTLPLLLLTAAGACVCLQTPIYPLVRPSVLVESFEPGAAIQGYVAASAAIAARAAVAALADEPSSSSSGGGGGSTSSSRGSIDDAVVSNGVGPCRMAAAADAARADSLARFEASVAQRSSDRETARLRGAIAEAGMHVYLKMLLKDNFIHAGDWFWRGGACVCVCLGVGVTREGPGGVR